VPLSVAPVPEWKRRRFGEVIILACSAGVMNRSSESRVGTVEPGLDSVWRAHAPPRLTKAPLVQGSLPELPRHFRLYA
jgi:hypothetical protein